MDYAGLDPLLPRLLAPPLSSPGRPALKAPTPTLREASTGWPNAPGRRPEPSEELLAACLQREVAAREPTGGEGRVDAARFPGRKALEDFDYDHARGLKREQIAHLGTLDFITARENVVFLGSPGTGKNAWPPGSRPRLPGRAPGRLRHRRAVGRPARRRPPRRAPAGRAATPGPLRAAGHQRGRLHPFEPEAANLIFPARLGPLRTRLPHRHGEQALRTVGRALRRRVDSLDEPLARMAAQPVATTTRGEATPRPTPR